MYRTCTVKLQGIDERNERKPTSMERWTLFMVWKIRIIIMSKLIYRLTQFLLKIDIQVQWNSIKF